MMSKVQVSAGVKSAIGTGMKNQMQMGGTAKNKNAPVNVQTTLSGPLSYIRAAMAESKVIGDGGKQKLQILAKIMKCLKEKFLELDEQPRSIDELLTELRETDIARATKVFLVQDGLPTNAKVTVTEDNKFIYKPPLPCRDRKSLLTFLRMNEFKVGGGILKDDIDDSVACAETILRGFENEDIITIVTRTDKRDIVFYNRRHKYQEFDEIFKDMYRSISVTSLDSRNVEAYLRKSGLTPFMEGYTNKVAPKCTRKKLLVVKKPCVRVSKNPKDNAHVSELLQNYGDGLEETMEVANKMSKHSNSVSIINQKKKKVQPKRKPVPNKK